MTQNKTLTDPGDKIFCAQVQAQPQSGIPTDEEIKTEWERYPYDPPNCECRPIGRRNCNACHLKLIEKARAAGRAEGAAEQREEIKRLRLCMLDALGPLDGGPSTCCEGASAEFSYAVDALKRGLNEK